jgi:hypothetical protein
MALSYREAPTKPRRYSTMSVWLTADGHRIEIVVHVAEDMTRTCFRVTDAAGRYVGEYESFEQLNRVIDMTTLTEQIVY